MRRWTFSVSAVFMAVALVCGASRVAHARQDSNSPSAGASATSASGPTSVPSGSSSDDQAAELKAAEERFDQEAQAAESELGKRETREQIRRQTDPPRQVPSINVADGKANGKKSYDPPNPSSPAIRPNVSMPTTVADSPSQNVFVRFGADLGMPIRSGIPVCNVHPGTSAANAGLKAGDVIMSLGGKKIRSLPALHSKLTHSRDGEVVTLGIVRHGAPMKVRLAVKKPPPS